MASSEPLAQPVRIVRRRSPPVTGSARSSLSKYDHSKYVSLTMEFRCNLRCVHCMIEGTMERLAPQGEAQLMRVLEARARHPQVTGLVLTGSEITLHRDLSKWARLAREHGFEHVRIQTHGMKLSSRAYCEDLIAAGVDEFFVSIAGADAATHDGITGVPGSFRKSLRGLEILDGYPAVATLTNTVVTARSYRQLPELVDRLRPLRRLVQMEFWFYFPMSESDDKGLLVSHADALPPLRQAIAGALRDGRGVEVKNFPECLLGEDAGALHNDQPPLFIDPAFWTEFDRNGFHQCVYREQCASSQCLGLNSAYIARFGHEPELLRPLSDTRPRVQQSGCQAVGAD
jgi:MoaA/NifB/PqqE/SkfB family radical SAM enzyme